MSFARCSAVESICRKCDDFFKERKEPTGQIVFLGVKKNIVPVILHCRKYGCHLDAQHGECAIDKCQKTIVYMKEFPYLEDWEKKELEVPAITFKIISGGQTGADQGGLFGARDAGFLTGGHAPRGFLTEDGFRLQLLQGFGLVDSGLDYVGRTQLNAESADITIWFGDVTSPGGKATKRAVKKAGKIFTDVSNWPAASIARLIQPYKVVNVAGNRESRNPGICCKVRERMCETLEIVKKQQEKE